MKKHKEQRKKLSTLLSVWPRGAVVIQSWLNRYGISRQLAEVYCQSGWLKRIGPGAYVRPGEVVEWSGAVHTLQFQLRLSFHVGGKTALDLQRHSHFIPLGKIYPLYLFTETRKKLPAWFLQNDWKVKLQQTKTTLFPGNSKLALFEMAQEGNQVRLSSSERAIFEVLDGVPYKQSFEEASLLMENLTTLRPELVQTLLEKCGSVKVKRLFLFLAEACQHPWVNKLDVSKINLGSGKRVIVKEGDFDPKYQITVEHSSKVPRIAEVP